MDTTHHKSDSQIIKKNKKLVLLNPPYTDEIYDFKQEFSVEYPLGLAYLAGTLKANGIENFDIFDSNALMHTRDECIEYIKYNSMDILGITATTTTITIAADIAEKVKLFDNNIIIVLGGPHATALPEETLKEFPCFDYVVQGEGELPLLELYNTLNNDLDIRDDNNRWLLSEEKGGLWFNDGLGVRHYNTIRSYKLDELPFPDRSKMPNEKYTMGPLMNRGFRGLQCVKIAGSRGCPFKCTFCNEGKEWPRYSYRSPENIFNEMYLLHKKDGAKHFFFVDDTINVRRKDLIKLCKMIIQSDMDIYWHCYARVYPLDKEMLDLMVESGCFGIMFGVESGDEKLIQTLGKNVTLNHVEKAFELCSNYNIKKLAFFMFGLPGDTHETCKNTIAFSKKINADLAFFSMTVPYPGTDMFDIFAKENVLGADYTWDTFAQHKREARHGGGALKGSDVVYYYNKAHVSFYIRPAYWYRVTRWLIKNPWDVKNYWWMIKEFFYSFAWVPTYINPGSRQKSAKDN